MVDVGAGVACRGWVTNICKFLHISLVALLRNRSVYLLDDRMQHAMSSLFKLSIQTNVSHFDTLGELLLFYFDGDLREAGISCSFSCRLNSSVHHHRPSWVIIVGCVTVLICCSPEVNTGLIDNFLRKEIVLCQREVRIKKYFPMIHWFLHIRASVTRLFIKSNARSILLSQKGKN